MLRPICSAISSFSLVCKRTMAVITLHSSFNLYSSLNGRGKEKKNVAWSLTKEGNRETCSELQ